MTNINNPANDNGATVNKIVQDKISKTYKEYGQEFVESTKLANTDEIAGVLMFAEHLDGSNVMTNELTLLAFQQARKIDRELLSLLIDEVGLEKAKELAQKVVANHRHTKVCPDEAQQAKDEPKNVDEQNDKKE